ncbi:TDP-N-acetylfucosamine:lipid II N-acetylfucosaminyltransferase [Polaribacter cellanae]|uniref:TDP-N-acetylfucosamine:lipid II N-acetylfucosaminyltransferase n=1 Tax=Polaribacter cellanae TaxID=2818493 RepID=A0A975H6J0_9FLAO|nr:TDP-N-acetylfucosamine:lipid II N-acetylfucosaminyltransferase [Polaribacter cellanae]QTE22516.1 TDP-N-acetylfucosamine:lipid II N-acetylfucosaminyltransferase [Polaribacter cellanae]
MIIHIASDEKFINSAYWQFNNIGEKENIFYILVQDVDKKLKHVNIEDGMNLVSLNIRNLKILGKSLDKATLVCFHGLDYYSSIVLNNLPRNQKVLWILFGKEVHNNSHLLNTKKNIGEKTYAKFLSKNILDRLKGKYKDYFRGVYYRIRNKTGSPFYEITKAMKRANYCGILYKEEFQLVKEKLNTKIEYIKFSYYPIEKMIGDINSKISGINILLGNSASTTNNHLEAFDMLKKMNLDGRKIITPLSYGDKNYKNEIEKKGKQILKDKFKPLVNFMPLHKYNAYVQNCSIVIMNHYRQQAVGNVLAMLWMGSKVYLDKRNTLYHYLKRIGVNIYEISKDFIPENKEALNSLTVAQQEHNRACLKEEINKEVLLNDLKIAINSVICR